MCFSFFAQHGALRLECPRGCLTCFSTFKLCSRRKLMEDCPVDLSAFLLFAQAVSRQRGILPDKVPMQHAASVGGVNWKTRMQYRWPMHSGNRVTSRQQAVHHDYGLWELKKTWLKFSQGRLHCYSCLHSQRTTLKGPVSKTKCHLLARKQSDIWWYFWCSFNLTSLLCVVWGETNLETLSTYTFWAASGGPALKCKGL